MSSKYRSAKRKVGDKKYVYSDVVEPSQSTYSEGIYIHPIIEDDLSIRLIPQDTHEKKSFQSNFYFFKKN